MLRKDCKKELQMVWSEYIRGIRIAAISFAEEGL